MPLSASSMSPEVDLIFKVLLVFSTILVILVWGISIYFCIKYRSGSSTSRKGKYKTPTWIELMLSFFIFIFGLGIFIWSAQVFYRLYLPPPSALEVNVIAKQWMWIFHETHGKDQINYLKVPLGKPIRLVMTSEDVIHSFFVPAFRIKQDVLPGRYTSMWFSATKIGSFEVLCTQYCGLSHSQMRAVIEVVSPEDYEKYLKEVPDQSIAQQRGEALYLKHSCNACHDSNQATAPLLKGIFGKQISLSSGTSVIADENYLRRSILTPNTEIVSGYEPIMPTFQGRLSEAEVLDIIHYLKAKR